MFTFDISSFEGRNEFDLELKGTDLSFDKGVVIEDGMKVSLVFTKDKKDTIIIEVKIRGNVISSCSRCLESYKSRVDTAFAAIYKDKKSFTEEDEQSEVKQYENNNIDVTDYLRETLILELPMKPLCGEGCKGLCPVCGTNLNKDNCGCKKEIKLNRFEELDKLKLKDKKSNN